MDMDGGKAKARKVAKKTTKKPVKKVATKKPVKKSTGASDWVKHLKSECKKRGLTYSEAMKSAAVKKAYHDKKK